MNKKTFVATNNNKKAFSLIELSIVLIIIGLLVAGVTGGAALIKNAQLRSIMSEARGYATAVNGFNERFQGLPGDYNNLIGGSFSAKGATTTGAVGVQGNADGKIQYYAPAAPATTADNRLEGNIAWQQLKNGAFIDATFTPGNADVTSGAVAATYVLTPGGTTTATINLAAGIPASKFSGAGWAFDYVAGASQNQNVVILTAAVTAPVIAAQTGAFNMQPVKILTPVDALSIDTKADDSLPQAGRVRSAGGTIAVSGASDGVGLASCNNAAYTTSESAVQCALSFQVDPS